MRRLSCWIWTVTDNDSGVSQGESYYYVSLKADTAYGARASLRQCKPTLLHVHQRITHQADGVVYHCLSCSGAGVRTFQTAKWSPCSTGLADVMLCPYGTLRHVEPTVADGHVASEVEGTWAPYTSSLVFPASQKDLQAMAALSMRTHESW